MKSNSTLLPWIGALISQFISGVAHGGFVGGVGTAAVDASNSQLATQATLIKATLIMAFVGGLKDVALYINANPMPNIFAPPVIAPVVGPVATPTVSDQPSTLSSPTVTPKS